MPQLDIFTIPNQVLAVFIVFFGTLVLLTYFYLPTILASSRVRSFFQKEMRLKKERAYITNLVFEKDSKLFQTQLLLKVKKHKEYLKNQSRNEK